jgi:Tfp pilus assembly protein PilF
VSGSREHVREVARRGARVAFLLALLTFAAACGGPRVAPLEGTPGPYDELAPEELALLGDARRAFDEARLDDARAVLADLQARAPQNLFAAALRQDVELAWLGQGGTLENVDKDLAASTLPASGSTAVKLRRWYRLQALRADATAFDHVLAARVEDDEIAALRLLDRAIALDPQCIWAHFGRAFVAMRQGDVAACRAALDRAIELDASHPRVRRLEATLLEALGHDTQARELLEKWTVAVEHDVRVSDAEVIDANLDLAHADLVTRRTDDALRRLLALDPADPQRRARRELLLADAWAADERWEESLESLRLARTYQPSSYTAWQSEALVLHHGLGDLEGALEAWRAAAEVAAQQAGVDAAAAVIVQQARVEILRLEREVEDAAAAAADAASAAEAKAQADAP